MSIFVMILGGEGVCVCAYPTALQMVNGLRIEVLGLPHEY